MVKRIVVPLSELIPGDRFGFFHKDKGLEEEYLGCMKLDSDSRIGRGMRQLLGIANIQLYCNAHYHLRYHGPNLMVIVEREQCECGNVLIRSFDRLGTFFVCPKCTPRMVYNRAESEPILNVGIEILNGESE